MNIIMNFCLVRFFFILELNIKIRNTCLLYGHKDLLLLWEIAKLRLIKKL